MVRAKKHLGQHFLDDQRVAQQIVDLIEGTHGPVLEIGPGEGVLTGRLMAREEVDLHMIDIDTESIEHLKERFPLQHDRIHEGDFLKMDLAPFGDQMSIIGNFPYNISSQILFRVHEERARVQEVVGMFQKEVAERVAAPPGSKTYGILSVLLQAYYDIDYCLTVPPEAFRPAPKVESGVIRLRRNDVEALEVDERLFKTVIKTAFGMRRKTIRNSLKGLCDGRELPAHLSGKRPEQLGVAEFVELVKTLS